MPLEVLLVLVVGGIAGLAGLMHLLGYSRGFDLADAGVAQAEWLRHWPGEVVEAVHLGQGAALVLSDHGPGLVRVFGADTVAHRIRGVADDPRGLRFGFGDFAVPDVVVRLENGQQKVWQAALKGRV